MDVLAPRSQLLGYLQVLRPSGNPPSGSSATSFQEKLETKQSTLQVYSLCLVCCLQVCFSVLPSLLSTIQLHTKHLRCPSRFLPILIQPGDHAKAVCPMAFFICGAHYWDRLCLKVHCDKEDEAR